MTQATFASLIEQAISWEITAHNLYQSFAEAFSKQPSVQAFWKQMACDEATHVELLRHTAETVSPSQLSKPVGKRELELVESTERALSRALLAQVETLDDAYEIAHEIESSEVNTIFELLVLGSIVGSPRHSLLAAQLDEHLVRLIQFDREFGQSRRTNIAFHSLEHRMKSSS